MTQKWHALQSALKTSSLTAVGDSIGMIAKESFKKKDLKEKAALWIRYFMDAYR